MNKLIKFFKNDNKSDDISFKDICEFCKTNIVLIGITILILALSHGYILNNSNVGIDTDIFVCEPTSDYNWFEIGRFGLIIEKVLLNLSTFNIFYAEILTFILLITFCVLSYYLFYKVSGKNYKWLFLVIPLVCFTSPMWAEQFIFTLQIAEIALSLNLCVLSVLFLYKWALDKKNIYCILGIVSAVLLIASYQSLIIIYMAYFILSFILLYDNNNEAIKEKIKDKNIIVVGSKLAVSFVLSYVIYRLVLVCQGIDTTCINGTNAWHIYFSRREILKLILSHFRSIILCEGIFFNIGLPLAIIIFFVLGIYKAVLNDNLNGWFYKFIYFCAFCAMCVAPFIFTIYLGQASVIRAQLYIPLIAALLWFYIIDYAMTNINKKVLNVVLVLFIIYITSCQLYYLSNLYYTDSVTREKDKLLAFEIAQDMRNAGIVEGSKVFFYGHYNGVRNPMTIHGQMIGISAFEFNHTMEPMFYYSSTKIVNLLKAYGYNYELIPLEQVFDARVAGAVETVPSWPNEEFIVKCDDFYVIKIFNY